MEQEDTLLCLPVELISKITDLLSFSDLWYLATCSKRSRLLAYKTIRRKYDIELLRPAIINPLANLVHAAVAFASRHGVHDTHISASVVQSVANHLAEHIACRTPSDDAEEPGLDFILDKALAILVHHIFTDKRDVVLNVEEEVMDFSVSPGDGKDTSGMLIVDLLQALHMTLTALFTDPAPLYHRLLMRHIQHEFQLLRRRHHAQTGLLCLKDPERRDFKILIKFICALLRSDLITAQDMNSLASDYIVFFFITEPSDFLPQDRQQLTSLDKNNGSLLWLQEVQFRQTVLLELLRTIISHRRHQLGRADVLYIYAFFPCRRYPATGTLIDSFLSN
ncbi:uncharacterized protein BYT42DRAFT_564921 [Radiomyces spectabilis]|uniref:uncharacterized protein n=1 Tax=Radiomyces spectabilis TaxID=64574 RepID=UPI00221E5D9A|nr:uncharacterized protein BYT42DRAFT_564921 [Radiomyces spectabilis]KAI8381008.1 hypothetical protein BYT42DRAFT_564921 [Radiomyces spectabilis]